MGQCNLFEAIRRFRPSGYDPIIQIAGSSEEYGRVDESDLPIRETTPLSPYGVSKVAQGCMGYQYWQSYRIRAVRTRAFNHGYWRLRV